MDLDSAIKHCLERANQDCSDCANEHKQLAEWLTELKCRRTAMSVDAMDEYTVQYFYAYGEWMFGEGYKKGLEDSIDKQPLSSPEAFKGHCVHCFQEGYERGKTNAVKHGRWTFIEQLSGGYYSYKCSECQHLENVEKREMLGNYCPHCGAKMLGMEE